ncbi:MAG: hypothetical protein WHT08_18090 [Bryobacteraceae bacterium]|jgi:hypothetical protein
MIRPGLYADRAGLLAIGEGRDGEVVAVRIPLDIDGLEDAAHKIIDAVRAMRLAHGEAAVTGGEKPKIVELRRSAAWN